MEKTCEVLLRRKGVFYFSFIIEISLEGEDEQPVPNFLPICKQCLGSLDTIFFSCASKQMQLQKEQRTVDGLRQIIYPLSV